MVCVSELELTPCAALSEACLPTGNTRLVFHSLLCSSSFFRAPFVCTSSRLACKLSFHSCLYTPTPLLILFLFVSSLCFVFFAPHRTHGSTTPLLRVSLQQAFCGSQCSLLSPSSHKPQTMVLFIFLSPPRSPLSPLASSSLLSSLSLCSLSMCLWHFSLFNACSGTIH